MKNKISLVLYGFILSICATFLLAYFSCFKVQAINNEQPENYEKTISLNNNAYLNLEGVSDFAVLNDKIYYLKTDGLYTFNETKEERVILLTNPSSLTATKNHLFLLEDNHIKIYNSDLTKVDLQNEFIAKIYEIKDYGDELMLAYENDNKVQITTLVLSDNNLSIKDTNEINLENCEIIDEPGKSKKITIDKNYLYVLQYTSSQNTLTRIEINNRYNYKVIDIDAPLITKMTTNIVNNKNIMFVSSKDSYFRAYSIQDEIENALTVICNNKNYAHTTPTFETGTVTQFTDFEIYNNEIYVLDSNSKCIQKFEYKEGPDDYFFDKSTKKETLFASSGYDLGRFYNVSKIHAQTENEIYISDLGNKRLQIVKNEEISQINNEQNIKFLTTTSNSIGINSNKNIFISSDLGISVFNNNGDLIRISNQYFTDGSNKTTFSKNILFAISYNDDVYAIDTNETSPAITKWNNSTLTFNKILLHSLNPYNISSVKDVALLNNENLVLLIDNTLLFVDTKQDTVKEINLASNVLEISYDYFNNVYLLTDNNEIVKLQNSNNYETENALKYTFKNSNKITHFSIIKSEDKFVAFDEVDSKLIIVKNNDFYDGMNSYTHPEDIYSLNAKTNIEQTAKIKQFGYAYQFPYNTGKSYELNVEDVVIVLNSLDNGYSYVLINENNSLVDCYVKTDNLNIKNYETQEPIEYIAININVKVYKYPTLLKQNNKTFILNNRIPINETIYVICENIDSMEKSEFFAIKYDDDKIGYVNKSDCLAQSEVPITNTIQSNAHIFTAGALKEVSIYNSNLADKYEIDKLPDDYKIIVKNYDKNEEFTLISYYDKDFNLKEGYIETKYIKMNNNSNLLIVSILIISAIVLITCIIVAFYLILKKKNNIEN